MKKFTFIDGIYRITANDTSAVVPPPFFNFLDKVLRTSNFPQESLTKPTDMINQHPELSKKTPSFLEANLREREILEAEAQKAIQLQARRLEVFDLIIQHSMILYNNSGYVLIPPLYKGNSPPFKEPSPRFVNDYQGAYSEFRSNVLLMIDFVIKQLVKEGVDNNLLSDISALDSTLAKKYLVKATDKDKIRKAFEKQGYPADAVSVLYDAVRYK